MARVPRAREVEPISEMRSLCPWRKCHLPICGEAPSPPSGWQVITAVAAPRNTGRAPSAMSARTLWRLS